jgi:hypothetical protein
MDTQNLSLIAGAISSLIFASSHIPMLLKAYRTRDLHSYSSLNLTLVNIGNLIYWFYVISLPPGPVWVLHSFYTVASVLLLVLYVGQAGAFQSARFRLLVSYLRAAGLRLKDSIVGSQGNLWRRGAGEAKICSPIFYPPCPQVSG